MKEREIVSSDLQKNGYTQRHDMKIVMGDANAKVGLETVHQPTIGKHSLHIAAGRQMTIKSTYFTHKRIHLQTWHFPHGHTFIQIDLEDTFLTS
jgi:hypothetical protein